MSNIKIPIYEDMTPKQRQYAHMALGGIAFVALFFVVSALLGGDPMSPSSSSAKTPTVKTLGAVAGESVDPQSAWIGGAGKEITTLKSDVLDRQQKQERINQDLLRELESLRQSKATSYGTQQVPAPTTATSPTATISSTAAVGSKVVRVEDGATIGGEKFPRTSLSTASAPQRQSATPNGYPPGQPLGSDGQMQAAEPSIGVIKVSLSSTAPASAGAAGNGSANTANSGKKEPKRVETFLPVSFTRAVLLGGMDAPTGGQAQRDPVPVLLKLVDNAFLPNEYRSAIKDCFVVAEGFGDVSAERAYIRTQLLSCVLKNGQSLEVPIKGSVFGEDGKNGMRGRLITKQGAILANALLSGIAAGIGQGFASSTQTTAVSALGSTTTSSTNPADILKSGLGNGVGKAMDRLAQYYINLAERTFPVIEIDAGRMVDIVITAGVMLDGTLSVTAEAATPPNGRSINRNYMLNAVNEVTDE